MKQSILSLFFILFPLITHAFTAAELEQKATTVVEGEITAVKCHEKAITKEFGEFHKLKATLKITNFLKGDMASELTLMSDDIKTPNYEGKHFIGDKGKYYLFCMNNICALIAKNSTEYTKRGKSEIPNCP